MSSDPRNALFAAGLDNVGFLEKPFSRESIEAQLSV
jgi:hypothetical protein